MSQDEWDDLLFDLTQTEETAVPRRKLAAHMARLEEEHEKLTIDILYLQRRVASLDAYEHARAKGGKP